MRTKALFVAMLLALAPLPSVAQDFDHKRDLQILEGLDAYTNGDYATAVQMFVSLAKQGDAFAQLQLGYQYLTGQGVLQNYITAHMWFNIAGANGDDLGHGDRNSVARLMTPADVSEAQRRARVCIESNYQDCD